MRRRLDSAPPLILVSVLIAVSFAAPLGAVDEPAEMVIVASQEDEERPDATSPADSATESLPASADAGREASDSKALERLRQERDRIAAENALASERVRQELAALEAEKQRLQLENSLRTERLNAEVAETRTRLDKIALETETINKQAALETARRRAELDNELAQLRAEEERNRVANAISSQKTEARLAELRLQETDFKIRRAELEMDVARLQTELSRREKHDMLRDLVPEDRVYVKEPFADGVLRVSDRRVEMSGVVTPVLASHVAERIDFYNNQSTEYPIFLVIDSSPGGSVMAGDQIIKAMAGSPAPVYVVLKSYAASMAAVITAVAPRSYAYPNAIIVHHQISWLGMGNLTQQREQMKTAEEWWRRLALPVAAKMGLTLDQFIAQMYQKNSDGDWREFADTAVKLKWVDQIVNTIWETSVDRNPDRYGSVGPLTMSLEQKTDDQGEPYVVLPRLMPHDCYFMHNPDRYYRLR